MQAWAKLEWLGGGCDGKGDVCDIPVAVYSTTQSPQLGFLFGCSKCLFTDPQIIYNVFIRTGGVRSGTSRDGGSSGYASLYLPEHPRLLPALLDLITLLP